MRDASRAVAGRLDALRLTLATAESCTGGLLGATLTAVPGASVWYRGGLVVYSNDLKVRLAGVDPGMLETEGAVSLAVARALARGARTRCDADLGAGVTGIAGPGGGTYDKPVGTVCLALAMEGEILDWTVVFQGDRDRVRSATVEFVLNRILERLDAVAGEGKVMPGTGAVVELALAGVVGYLLGTFPSGSLVCRLFRAPDPWTAGSGSIGATNVYRVAGVVAGLLTLVLDLAKGWLAVSLAGEGGAPLAALAVVLGHMAPPWSGFRGGKGIATAAGAFAALAFWPLIPALIVFGLILATTRIVAAASLSAAVAYPLFAIMLSAGRSVAGVGILIAVMVAVGHRENLIRIREGREAKIGPPGDGRPRG